MTCPGCQGRGFVVVLGSMMACQRCHGNGHLDPIKEALDRARKDTEFAERLKRNIADQAEVLKRLGDG